MRSRKLRPFEREEIPPHEAAERRLKGASQPVSTEAGRLDLDEDDSEHTPLERTMEDYYFRTDVEEQGGVPSAPPEHNPMPLQDLRKPKGPPKHNM